MDLKSSLLSLLIWLPIIGGGLTLFFHDEMFIKLKPTIIYALFAKKVPEVIDVIENRQEDIHEGLTEGGLGGEGDTGFSDDGEGISAEDGPAEASSTYDADYGPSAHSKVSDIPRKTGVQIGKEEITVNGVKFKNQPEVMAETIKQLMEQDKD